LFLKLEESYVVRIDWPLARLHSLGALLLISLLSGCQSGQESSLNALPGQASAAACGSSENLLLDTAFTREGEFARTWRRTQHTGEPSFSATTEGGVLEIRRIATQPWTLFFQNVEDARLSGATIRYTVELKGDLPTEPPLHGFDHVGGLYLRLGQRGGSLAEHEPNSGQWDWQPVTVEASVPKGVTAIRAGFVHQAGGALWARSPSLVIIDCGE
jgi:hypothetical protein